MVKITDYKTHKKPISKEDQEVFNWIGKKLQDRLDGKEEIITDEQWQKDADPKTTIEETR
jgi:hypothetical protein